MDYNIQKHMKTIELDKVLELLAEKQPAKMRPILHETSFL